MSQYPPSTPPVDYAHAQPLVPQRRPTVVLVIAIIAIVFSALTLICTPVGLIMQSFVASIDTQGTTNPALTFQNENAQVRTVTTASAVAAMVYSLARLIASISAIQMKKWARNGMIYVAVIGLILTAVDIILHFALISPELKKAAQTIPELQAQAKLAPVVLLFQALFHSILPVLTIILFRRKEVVEAFERAH